MSMNKAPFDGGKEVGLDPGKVAAAVNAQKMPRFTLGVHQSRVLAFSRRVLRDTLINCGCILLGLMIFKFYKRSLSYFACAPGSNAGCLTPAKLAALTNSMVWAEVGVILLFSFSTGLYLLARLREGWLHRMLVYKLCAAVASGFLAMLIAFQLMDYRNILLARELALMNSISPTAYLVLSNSWQHQLKMFFVHL